ncbi:hypothetical protein PSV08DRAFT_247297 [Bipolaris maydis]|uniref:uncharacterized protein n=1 Tax=Cochliobolus heterostrophus TaxID=5016 RepID=UPI0024D29AAE|nr:hypothetical protein PSV08DRAFT_247297 [Bipolaris maydis]
MAKPQWLWARHIYFLITAIILLSAGPTWAQPCYDGNLPDSCPKIQDLPKISTITTGTTLESSLLPPPLDVGLRPRDVAAFSVDGYAYKGCVGDDGNKRVLGGPTIEIVSLEPNSCGNLHKNYDYAAALHQTLPRQPERQLRRILRNESARTSTVDTFVTSTTTASSTTIVSSSSASPSTQAPRPISNDDVTLSKGAIAGISVGSAVGAVLICAAICCFWFYQHHQRSRKVSEEVVASPAGQ